MTVREVIVPLNARALPRDSFSRPMRDLRISVMDRCNFRCPYCMPRETFHEQYRFLGSQERLSFAEIVRPIYRAYAARKPIMVAETASTTSGGNQPRWISAVLTALRAQYPRIKAVVWFEHPPEWSVRSSTRALSAFRVVAAASLFSPAPNVGSSGN